jgi:hypothetical protein
MKVERFAKILVNKEPLVSGQVRKVMSEGKTLVQVSTGEISGTLIDFQKNEVEIFEASPPDINYPELD